jgi:hypothetical protein
MDGSGLSRTRRGSGRKPTVWFSPSGQSLQEYASSSAVVAGDTAPDVRIGGAMPTTSRIRNQARPGSGTSRTVRGLSSQTQIPKRRRADPAAPTYIVAGAVVAVLGLGFAVGLAISPGAAERALALKLLPWLVAVGGIAFSVVGFMRLGPSRPV